MAIDINEVYYKDSLKLLESIFNFDNINENINISAEEINNIIESCNNINTRLSLYESATILQEQNNYSKALSKLNINKSAINRSGKK